MDRIGFPPGPTSRVPGLFAMAYARDPLGMMVKMAREYGDIVHFRLGGVLLYLVSHPDYIREVLTAQDQNFTKSLGLERTKSLLGDGLLTSEGELHRRQRRLIQPAFHRARMEKYAGVMTAYALRARERWRGGEVLDIHQEMMRLTLAIVSKTLFDADVETEAPDIGEDLRASLEFFNHLLLPFVDVLDRLPLPSNLRYRRAREHLNATIYKIIEERRASGEDKGDFLSMLLAAQDMEGDGTGMTDEQVRDEALTLFLAGHETTSNALTWTWYLLSQNPSVEAKLHREIDGVLDGRVPTMTDIANLPFTEAVLRESMRIFPPAWTLGRRAIADFRLGDYLIPAGSTILMSQYVVHHDSRFYPEPQDFSPERWTPDMRAKLPKFAYFPFGGGSRLCIGEPFAWTEGILLLATLSQRWRPRLVPGHAVALKPMITLRPKYGMLMTVHERKEIPRLEASPGRVV